MLVSYFQKNKKNHVSVMNGRTMCLFLTCFTGCISQNQQQRPTVFSIRRAVKAYHPPHNHTILRGISMLFPKYQHIFVFYSTQICFLLAPMFMKFDTTIGANRETYKIFISCVQHLVSGKVKSHNRLSSINEQYNIDYWSRKKFFINKKKLNINTMSFQNKVIVN